MTVATMNYPPAPGWRVAGAQGAAVAESEVPGEPPPEITSAALTGLLVVEEHDEARLLVARQDGYERGQADARAEVEGIKSRSRDELAKSLRDFAQERDKYFQGVEREVVSLALAIARKILHREAQVEPLLLAGLVRVALEKMAASQPVRMQVHPSQVAAWGGYFDAHPEWRTRPEVSGDETLAADSCRLETEMGRTELNLENQLKEIENGLFDLLAQRPESKAVTDHAG